jgi:hypothetical protein
MESTSPVPPTLDQRPTHMTAQSNRAGEMPRTQQPGPFDLSDFAKYVVVTRTAKNWVRCGCLVSRLMDQNATQALSRNLEESP